MDHTASKGDIAATTQLFEEAPENLGRKVPLYNEVLKAIANAKDVDQAEAWYQRMKRDGVEPTARTFGKLLKCAVAAKDIPKAEYWFAEMEQSGLQADDMACSYMLSLFSEKEPSYILGWLRKRDPEYLKMDAFSNALIAHYYAKVELPDDAGKYLDTALKFAGAVPSSQLMSRLCQAFSAVAIALVVLGRPREAQEVMDWMSSSNIIPFSEAAYEELMALKIYQGEPEEVETLLMRMKFDGIAVTGKQFRVAKLLASRGLANILQRYLQRLQEMGARIGIEQYNCLIEACANAGKPAEAVKKLKELDEMGVRPTVETYSAVIRAFVRTGDMETARGWMDTMKAAGVMPNVETFDILSGRFAQEGDSSQVLNLLAEMEALELSPTTFTYNCLLNAYARERQPTMAVKALKEMESKGVKPDTFSYSHIVNAWAQVDNAAMAVKWLKRISTDDSLPPPNEATYTMALSAVANAGDLKTLQGLLKDMKAAGLQPTACTHTAIVTGLTGQGLADEAVRWLETAIRARQPMDPQLLAAGVEAALEAGEKEVAAEWLAEMDAMLRSKGVKFTSAMVSAAVIACVKFGALDKAKRWFAEAQSSGIVLRSTLFQKTAEAFAEVGEPRKAAELLASMEEYSDPRRKSDSSTAYTATIRSLKGAGRDQEAETLMDRMRTAGVELKKSIFDENLRKCVAKGNVDGAIDAFREMEALGMKPDLISWNTIIATLAKAERPKEALEWFEQLSQSDLKPDVFSWTSAINACSVARDPQRARELFQQMRQEGVQPNDRTYGALVKAFAGTGREGLDEAVRIVMLAERDGVSTTEAMYSSIVSGYAKTRQPEQAAQWLEDMETAGFKASPGAYANVVAACRAPDKPELAEQILRKMLAKGHRPNDFLLGTARRIIGVARFVELEKELKTLAEAVQANDWAKRAAEDRKILLRQPDAFDNRPPSQASFSGKGRGKGRYKEQLVSLEAP